MAEVSTSSGWYIVDAAGQPVGPYDTAALQGLLSNAYINPDTSMWREGRSEWQPLKDIGELQPLMRVVQEVAKAAQKSAKLDELDAFQAEISALEAEAAAAPSEPGGDEAEGARTPEELEFEDDDGTMYVWDRKLRKYMPKAGNGDDGGGDAGYDPELMTFVAEDEVLPTLAAVKAAAQHAGDPAEARNNKRKAPGDNQAAAHTAQEESAAAAPAATATAPSDAGQAGPGGKKQKGKGGKANAEPAQPAQWFDLKNNTSIYVNGLPLDVTEAEVAAAFSKFGLIKEQANKQPRIKLYRNASTGFLKGDALVTFLREPSVALAVQLMDGTPFRPDMRTNMTVQPAKFEQKGEAYVPKGKPTKKEKKLLAAQQERLLSWGGCDDKLLAEQSTVIIKHMFSPLELASELGAAEALEAEVRAEAARLGPVDKVRVFKNHPEGVVSVRFKTADGTQACLAKMHGRFFDGRQLAAEMWDGITNYAAVKVQETEEEQEARLAAYAREVEEKAAAAGQAVQDSSAPSTAPVGPAASHEDSGLAVPEARPQDVMHEACPVPDGHAGNGIGAAELMATDRDQETAA